VGKAEMAHHGTLFLDEIGDLPLLLQGKILRLVQEKQFERVGGVQTLSVDVRVVAATNRDLKEAVAAKQFREDLFFASPSSRSRSRRCAAAAATSCAWPTPSSRNTGARWGAAAST
jgi:transcriptional regulator of acetoin/glycerol metabolism